MSTYRVDLTGGQLRVVHEILAMVLNAPAEEWGLTVRDHGMLDKADSKITAAWRDAARTESVAAR